MFGHEELTELNVRKQALLLESDLNRLTLQLQCEHLRQTRNWLTSIGGGPRKLGFWVVTLAPLAGLAMTLGMRRSRRLFGSLATAVAVAKPLIRFWRSSRESSDDRK
jgi:hypothetical protein